MSEREKIEEMLALTEGKMKKPGAGSEHYWVGARDAYRYTLALREADDVGRLGHPAVLELNEDEYWPPLQPEKSQAEKIWGGCFTLWVALWAVFVPIAWLFVIVVQIVESL